MAKGHSALQPPLRGQPSVSFPYEAKDSAAKALEEQSAIASQSELQPRDNISQMERTARSHISNRTGVTAADAVSQAPTE